MRSSFIALYQESVRQTEVTSKSNDILLGTQTRTDSQEQADQDPRNFRTQTVTQTRENGDSDSSCYKQFSILP